MRDVEVLVTPLLKLGIERRVMLVASHLQFVMEQAAIVLEQIVRGKISATTKPEHGFRDARWSLSARRQ